MATEIVKWSGVISVGALGLTLIFNPSLIPIFPAFFHYIIGGLLGGVSLFSIIAMVK